MRKQVIGEDVALDTQLPEKSIRGRVACVCIIDGRRYKRQMARLKKQRKTRAHR